MKNTGFIKVTSVYDKCIFINIDHIVDFSVNNNDGLTYINYTNKEYVRVKETPNKIKDLILQAKGLTEEGPMAISALAQLIGY